MDIAIYAKDGYSNIWADNYVKRQPQARKSIRMPDNASAAQVKDVVKKACTAAGTNGSLVFIVGHGGFDKTLNDPKVGVVDSAPQNKFRLGGAFAANVFVSVFYDVNLSGPTGFSDMDNDLKFNQGTSGAAERQAHWKDYKEIADAVKAANLLRVYFLTCNVGNSPDFIKKIANDWDVVVQAYKKRMVLAPQPNGKVRVHQEGDAPGFGTNIPESEEEIPLGTEVNSYRAGPPLP